MSGFFRILSYVIFFITIAACLGRAIVRKSGPYPGKLLRKVDWVVLGLFAVTALLYAAS